MAKYDPKIYNECKRLFVREGLSPGKISKVLGGKPVGETIRYWANKKDDEGNTWEDLRKLERDKQYEAMSPNNLALDVLDRIRTIINGADFDIVKHSDAISKLTKILEKFTDPRHQIHVMFVMLSEMVQFVQKHYPQYNTKDFYELIRDFKSQLRSNLEGR